MAPAAPEGRTLSFDGSRTVIIDDSYQGENIAFIVGCPRSGTTWLQRMLAEHPLIATGQESHLFDFHVGRQLQLWDYLVRETAASRGGVGMGCYISHQEYLALIRRFMHSLLRPILEHVPPGGMFLDKTPEHALFIPEIQLFLPRARIIHVLRDPRDVVASLTAASRGWAAGWAPAGAARAAQMWIRHVQAVHSAAPMLPADQFLELRYEDMHRDTGATLQQVAAFLGREWSPAAINEAIAANTVEEIRQGGGTRIPVRGEFATPSGAVMEPEGFVRNGRPASWKRELSLRQQGIVRLVAGADMERLGYARSHGPARRAIETLLRFALGGAVRLHRRRKP
jgi:hypothetical protein